MLSYLLMAPSMNELFLLPHINPIGSLVYNEDY